MADKYKSAWSPLEYLAQYYATSGVAQDEQGILQFVLDFLLEKKQKFTTMLEVGCGPTIHHILPFVPYVGELFMADYLDTNLQEIQNWVARTSGAHDWTNYLTGVMSIEGNTSKSALQERVRLLRTNIAGLLTCDVLNSHPLGAGSETVTFPLVTSFYTLECLGTDKDQWRRAIGNVSSLVAPGGYLIMSSLHKADKYLVCGKEFPTTNIDEEDMRTALIDAGFQLETIKIRVCPCEWADEGFSSILVASAQK